jgi:L-threonylcarbamoyladenylate synthase
MSGDLAIIRAARALRAGAVIAYPTEGVWGLGCDPLNRAAVERLLALKRRPVAKGLILIAAEAAMFEPLFYALSPAQRQQLDDSWPGPSTWIVPDPDHRAPAWIRGRHDSLALRVTAHPLASRLSRAFGGPIVSTSANPAGLAPALTAYAVRRYFGGLVMIVPGETGGSKTPSTIRDLCSGRVLRGN